MQNDFDANAPKLKFLDLSGYMFSGKAAVSDLVREHCGFHVPNYRSEFDLLRIPHGLLDLKHALVDEWSWVRSDKAIREFIQLTDVLGRTPQNIYEKLFRCGFGYSNIYPCFLEKTKKFVEEITEKSWPMQWPYELSALSPIEHAKLKLLSKLKGVHAWPEIHYRLCSGDNFLDKAKQYISDLLVDDPALDYAHTVVTHNMLEPYDPASGFCFFDDIKSIVVDRDVRDIYMTSIAPSIGFNDVVPLYSKIIGAFDIDVFISRQKILRRKTNYSANKNILRVYFEDLVLNYDDTCHVVQSFLNLSATEHQAKLKYFDPEKSINNVGLWKKASKAQLAGIYRLEQEFPELCRQ